MNLAAPLIPGPFSSKSVLEWRIKLLKKHKIIDTTELLEDLVKAKERKLSNKKGLSWINLAKSELLPTETEKVVLAAVHWMQTSQAMSDRNILAYDQDLIRHFKSCKSEAEFSKKFSKEISSVRKEIEEVAAIHMATSVPMIRAKLAAVELISAFSYHTILPLLIAETPRYLKCPNVNMWFEEVQTNSIYAEGEPKDKANEILRFGLKSLAVDRNKLKSKIYQKWHIYFQHEKIKDYLNEELRIDGITDPESKFKFEKFCRDFKISKEMQNRTLSKSFSAKDVATDILVNQKIVSSSNAFDKIVLEINSIRDRHSTLLHLPGTKNFLDLPAYAPYMMASGNLWDLLEKVTL